jgi:hypothetical protein
VLFLRPNENSLVVLDEIYRVPELFQQLRGIIDEGRRTGHGTGRFLILGSASMALLRWVPHPRRAFVFAARVGSVSLTSKGRIDSSLFLQALVFVFFAIAPLSRTI